MRVADYQIKQVPGERVRLAATSGGRMYVQLEVGTLAEDVKCELSRHELASSWAQWVILKGDFYIKRGTVSTSVYRETGRLVVYPDHRVSSDKCDIVTFAPCPRRVSPPTSF
jgi:hypothetical protein